MAMDSETDTGEDLDGPTVVGTDSEAPTFGEDTEARARKAGVIYDRYDILISKLKLITHTEF